MKIQPPLWFFVCWMCLGIFGNGLFAQNKEKSSHQKVKKKSDLYLRAPGTVPGTLPEMRQASYWIAKLEHGEKVVLDPEQIARRNTAFRERMANPSSLDDALMQRIDKQLKSRPGLLAHVPDIGSMSPTEVIHLTRQWVQSGTDFLRSREFGNIMAIGYGQNELDAIENEISYKQERNKEPPLPGITITQSRLHIIPPIKPEYIGLFTNGKARWDLWNLDVLPVGTPVHILYSSRTGAFSFVLSQRGYGWVASEEIALGPASEIDAFTNDENFTVCTGDRVPFYTNENCTSISGWLLMGDRLPMISANPKSIAIPFRNANGKFSVEKAWLKPNADVQLGYLPYTQKNVAIQAFKLLDNLYDWTGAWYGRNHATNLRDIFKTFGFQLPANGILLAAFAGKPQIIDPDQGREDQFKSILSNVPFLTLQISENSHSQLFIGDHKGLPIVFDAHGYSYKDEDGNDLELKRWVVGTIEMPDYFLKQEISFVKLY